MNEFPKLRDDIEGSPVEHDGQTLIMLRDRLGYTQNALLIQPAATDILMLMDGKNSMRDIQAEYMRKTGQLLYTEELQKLVELMDENLLLDNERFNDIVEEAMRSFRADPVRRMQFADKSYSADPDELRKQIQGFFAKETGGPGFPEAASPFPSRSILGLVAPHIDIQAGGTCYAHAYKALSEAKAPGTWVVLGIGHEPVENLFSVTPKDFETPLGAVRCDREFCEELIRRSPRDILKDEFIHKKEHTIEFQAVFLSHFQPEARIVPVICSFGLEDWGNERAYIDEFAMLLKEIGASGDGSTGFIASVDLAHIGPRYGHRSTPDQGVISRHMQADADLMKTLESCDPTEFMSVIRRERNARQVCGVAALYVLSKILEGTAKGQVLDHSYSVVDNQNSFVTFASMAFYEK